MAFTRSHPSDFLSWLALAREVEPLFGPMVDEEGFHAALRQAIGGEAAFCIRHDDGDALCGGVIISPAANEIVWLAVAERFRRRGFGRALLRGALDRLERRERIRVQTFAAGVAAGAAARRLYLAAGFSDVEAAGANPAGIATVIMQLPAL
ncbi:GNAT family N-acetyltransferase [Plasticicumulans acidivorans]|uniref:Acetyltransferase (GNAT) family protein n=1 Tax=Plasticicumulans acidivorans TaxID=886464 RepID=A0A317MYS7_9GAMM|nr:GNAT family N-acetyltransferase [Plasticicumulans acidivorans]PWV64581.1 acetyltransferase (GNAT) family protein [Plasticicumulans acidivorans]